MKKILSKSSDLIIGLAVCFLIYGDLAWVQSGVLGTVLLAAWLGLSAKIIKGILARIFSITAGLASAIGCCLALFIFGFVMNVSTAWLKFNDLSIASSFASVMIILSIIDYWMKKDDIGDSADIQDPEPLSSNAGLPKWLIAVYAILCAIAWQLINISITGKYLTSPWQILNPWYIAVIFLLSVVVFSSVLIKKKINLSLVIIIMFSIIIHCYLLVYQAGFGGDRWRHLGSEYRLIQGIEQTMAEKWQPQQDLAGIKVPKALINSAQLSYGFNWSLSSVISKLTNIDVFFLDQYLMILLWSVFLPLIFFVGARQISNDSSLALLSAAMPNMLYILQYYGALTLPSSYGALYFALMIMMWLAYWRRPSKKLLVLNLMLTAVSYLGYSLMFALNILMAILALALKVKGRIKYLIIAGLGMAVFIAEWLSPYSQWHWELMNMEFIRRLIYNNILYFDNGLIRPINFPASRFIFLLLSGLFFALIISALAKCWKSKNNQRIFLAWLFAILASNYLLSWYFLDGAHILCRRLDVFMGIVLAWLLALVLSYNINRASRRVLICLVIVFSATTTLNYISGPVIGAAVTTDEVAAVRLVRQQMGERYMDYCFLANTWPLLAFETYTYREVAAGNFPMYENHQQPERVRLFTAAINNPSAEIFSEAKRISGKNICFLMINKIKLSSSSDKWLRGILGAPINVGDNLIWKF